MYRLNHWSVRNARPLKALYAVLERVLVKCHPLFARVGYRRVEKVLFPIERLTKGLLFNSQSCGKCVIGSTGMSCPMNCPKLLRNGPCGGVRPDGKCEIDPGLDCVWVMAWEGNKRLRESEYPIQFIQAPLDNRLRGTSAWLREVRARTGMADHV